MRQCAVTRIVAGRAGAALANTRARRAGQVATDANLVARLHIAGEDAVPEAEFFNVSIDGVVTPDDANVEHIEMIVCQPMHAAVVVVMTVGNDHARDVIRKLRLDVIANVVVDKVEGGFS
ncbi:MAG: hypothetical protein WBN23_06655, partial [Woeseia sp.]